MSQIMFYRCIGCYKKIKSDLDGCFLTRYTPHSKPCKCVIGGSTMGCNVNWVLIDSLPYPENDVPAPEPEPEKADDTFYNDPDFLEIV